MLRIAISAYHTCIRRPCWGFQSEYCHAVSYEKKLEWLDYPTVKKNEDMFVRFDTVHEYDGRTDRQTPHDDSIARQNSGVQESLTSIVAYFATHGFLCVASK